jgi:hypothetical protein
VGADGVEHVMRHVLHPMVVARVAHDLRDHPVLALSLEARATPRHDGGAVELLHPASSRGESGRSYGEGSARARVAPSVDDISGGDRTTWYRASTLEALDVDIASAHRNQPPPTGFGVRNAPEIEQLLATI